MERPEPIELIEHIEHLEPMETCKHENLETRKQGNSRTH